MKSPAFGSSLPLLEDLYKTAQGFAQPPAGLMPSINLGPSKPVPLLPLALFAEQFEHYIQLLWQWNQATNLISRQSSRDEATFRLHVWLHTLDSLRLLGLLPTSASVIDLGSGAGFPGLILAMIRPDLKLCLMDSVGKKARFLRHVASQLKLDAVEVLQMRWQGSLDSSSASVYHWMVSRAAIPIDQALQTVKPWLLESNQRRYLTLISQEQARLASVPKALASQSLVFEDCSWTWGALPSTCAFIAAASQAP